MHIVVCIFSGTMEPLPGYDAWKTDPPDFFNEEESEDPEERARFEEEQARYDDYIDSLIDADREREP